MKDKFLLLCQTKFGKTKEFKPSFFERSNHEGYFSVSFYDKYCFFTHIERGGLKEGYETFELKFNSKNYKTLKDALKYL